MDPFSAHSVSQVILSGSYVRPSYHLRPNQVSQKGNFAGYSRTSSIATGRDSESNKYIELWLKFPNEQRRPILPQVNRFHLRISLLVIAQGNKGVFAAPQFYL